MLKAGGATCPTAQPMSPMEDAAMRVARDRGVLHRRLIVYTTLSCMRDRKKWSSTVVI